MRIKRTLRKVQTPNGHAMIFNNPIAVLEAARRRTEHDTEANIRPSDSVWVGREFQGWDDLIRKFSEPWKEGIERVEQMVEVLKSKIPEPQSIKRKPRWSELDGEVNVDRVMHGDPDFYRSHTRKRIRGPSNITLICAVQASKNVRADDIFWNGAVATALVDLLEQAGYSVEVWMWSAAYGVYCNDRNTDFRRSGKRGSGSWMARDRSEYSYGREYEGKCASFTACPLKKGGAPFDMQTLINSMSGWFYRTAIHASKFIPVATAQVVPYLGFPYEPLKNWIQFLDVSEGCLAIELPQANSECRAIDSATTALKRIEDPTAVQVPNDEIQF